MMAFRARPAAVLPGRVTVTRTAIMIGRSPGPPGRVTGSGGLAGHWHVSDSDRLSDKVTPATRSHWHLGPGRRGPPRPRRPPHSETESPGPYSVAAKFKLSSRGLSSESR
jgi:hypothetical protein